MIGAPNPKPLLSEVNDDIERAKERLGNVNGKLAVKTRELSCVKEELTNAQAKFEQVEINLSIALKQRSKFKDEAVKLTIDMEMFTASYDRKRSQMDRELSDMLTQISEADKQLAALTTTSSALMKHNEEQTHLLNELTKKIKDSEDLQHHYTNLIEVLRTDETKIRESLGARKIEHDETIAKLNRKMAEFKSSNVSIQEKLSVQVREQREKLQTIKGEIAAAIARDAERVKNLRIGEDSLEIKIRAFNREREEFDGKRKRLARISRT